MSNVELRHGNTCSTSSPGAGRKVSQFQLRGLFVFITLASMLFAIVSALGINLADLVSGLCVIGVVSLVVMLMVEACRSLRGTPGEIDV